MLKIFVLLLLLLGLNELYADNGWSEPVLIYDKNFNANIDFVVDKNNTFYLTWSNCKNDTGFIMQSKSTNLGLNWTVPEKVSQNLSGRYSEPSAVFDLENNQHIVYTNFYNRNIYYRKKMNNVWSDEVIIEPRVDTHLQLHVDLNNRIYLLGNIYKYAYYKYLENNTWTQFKPVNDSLMMFEHSGTMDKNNNLHLFGMSYVDSLPAYYCMFDKNQEKWSRFTDLSNNKFPSLIIDGFIDNEQSHNPLLNIVASAGNYAAVSTTYYHNSLLYSDVWSQPEQINEQFDMFHKRIIVDQNNQPHIFDLTDGLKKLYRFYLSEDNWQSEVVYYDVNYKIMEYCIILKNDQVYMIYGNDYNDIYMIHKDIPTSINNSEFKIKNYELVNYPNPFNNSTQINFVLPQVSDTKLAIFNAKGELVQTLFTGKLKSGSHSLNFNATGLNSGVYYCRLSAGKEVKTTKLMLLK